MATQRLAGELRFVGHTGEIRNLRRLSMKTMFVVDSNLVLNLLSKAARFDRLPPSYRSFLLATRQRALASWKVQEKFIPIDPVLAIMELTKQSSRPDFSAFLSYFDDFFSKVYMLDGYDPAWVKLAYDPALGLVRSTQPSIQETVLRVFSLIPPPGPRSNKVILDACDSFLQWTLDEQDRLVLMGGPLLQAAIYAIAGSPQARRLLKVELSKRMEPSEVAANVAWDFMYWIHSDINYHFKRYDNTVVCTADAALVDLLSLRRNKGPRFSAVLSNALTEIPSAGEIEATPLARIDETSLGADITELLVDFWRRLNARSVDHVKFGLQSSLFRLDDDGAERYGL